MAQNSTLSSLDRDLCVETNGVSWDLGVFMSVVSRRVGWMATLVTEGSLSLFRSVSLASAFVSSLKLKMQDVSPRVGT